MPERGPAVPVQWGGDVCDDDLHEIAAQSRWWRADPDVLPVQSLYGCGRGNSGCGRDDTGCGRDDVDEVRRIVGMRDYGPRLQSDEPRPRVRPGGSACTLPQPAADGPLMNGAARAVEALRPLDEIRRLGLRALAEWPLGRTIARRRSVRLPLLMAAHALAAFALALLAPAFLIAVAPLALGVPHLAADVRHLLLWRASPRWWLVRFSVVP